MNEAAAFDVLAADYDAGFTRSITGQAQRHYTRQWLGTFLDGRSGLRILEINCGTGEDACWLSGLGHEVIATDASAAMIQVATQKAIGQQVSSTFLQCSFDQLGHRFAKVQFDLIFSNFAGLNCVPPGRLMNLSEELASLLAPNGHMAVVLFGKYCCWETLYYLLRFNGSNATRRWSNKPLAVPLHSQVSQEVHYYPVKHFLQRMPAFQLKEKRPVGLFLPPSYLEGYMQRHPRFFQTLQHLEKISGGPAWCSQLADHLYLLLKKKQ